MKLSRYNNFINEAIDNRPILFELLSDITDILLSKELLSEKDRNAHIYYLNDIFKELELPKFLLMPNKDYTKDYINLHYNKLQHNVYKFQNRLADIKRDANDNTMVIDKDKIMEQLQWFEDNYELNNLRTSNEVCYFTSGISFNPTKLLSDAPVAKGVIRCYKMPYINNVFRRNITVRLNSEVLEELALRERNLEEMGYEFCFIFNDDTSDYSLLEILVLKKI